MAVNDVGEKIKSSWNGQGMNGKQLANYVASKYFVHPCKTKWMDEKVLKWANANPEAVFQAESKKRYEYLEKLAARKLEHVEEVVDSIRKLQKE